MKRDAGYVGVADHGGWAVMVTVRSDGRFVDRRRVELVDAGLPKLPHHHDAQGLPVDEGVALIERVARSADGCARACLETLEESVPMKIVGISIRACPPLPETVADRLANYRAQNVADTVMYRDAVARAAEGRGWFVRWYEVRSVLGDAAKALGRESVDDLLAETGKRLGPPWTKDHRVAMAAAIAMLSRRT